MMFYRTRTYIAADWTEDIEIIEKLREWNRKDFFRLEFTDAHELTSARDSSLACSIKKSLSKRLSASKTFVLIIGKNTKELTKGSCRYCPFYLSKSWYNSCSKGHNIDSRSFIQYECEKAIKDGLKTVVIYNYANVDKTKCPEYIKYIGTHISAYYVGADGKEYWNIKEIADAINS